MAVGRIDHQHIHAGADQRLRPLVIVNAHRRPDAQPAARVFAGVGEVGQLVDVFDRDEAFQFIVIVHQQQFLDFIFRQNPSSRFKRCMFRGRDEVVLAHHLRQPLVVVGEEAQIAAREDALEVAVDGDRHAADLVLLHDAAGVADGFVGRQRDRVGNDAVFAALDLVHLVGLVGDGQVFVDDANAAFLCKSNRQIALGDGVHRRRDDGHIEADIAGELGADVHVARHNVAVRGFKQHVVEGDALVGNPVLHGWGYSARGVVPPL